MEKAAPLLFDKNQMLTCIDCCYDGPPVSVTDTKIKEAFRGIEFYYNVDWALLLHDAILGPIEAARRQKTCRKAVISMTEFCRKIVN